jgi:MoxR-vWA-beta-propeller ternary system domain bpX2
MAVTENAMNFPWAICVALEDAASLSPLRQIAGIEVGEAGAQIWLRGRQGDEKLDAKLAAVPARTRYEWLGANELRQIDQRIPSVRFPALRWQPLDAWLQVTMPAASMAGEQPNPVSLRLVRSTCEQEPELLLADLDDLVRFASMAAQVRLERLKFAANGEGRVLVRGRPLPSVPGQHFVLHGGVAVPAGFSWEPQVAPAVLARRFAVADDALVVWNEDQTITRLHSEQFVPLSRSALRATQQALLEAR